MCYVLKWKFWLKASVRIKLGQSGVRGEIQKTIRNNYIKTGARWITRSDIWKKKSFLEKTWGWGFRSCQEACGSDCGGVQMWPASQRLHAICNGLKMPQEGSSASPLGPLFPQKAIPKTCPVIDGFTSRDSLDHVKEERSGCYCLHWKSLVTDGSSWWSGVWHPRERHPYFDQKRIWDVALDCKFTLEVSEEWHTQSGALVAALSGMSSGLPVQSWPSYLLPETGHFSLDIWPHQGH